MLSYDECKQMAEEKAESYGLKITKAYRLGDAFVFDTDIECEGIMPVVIDPETEKTTGLWRYINDKDLEMGDMKEIEL